MGGGGSKTSVEIINESITDVLFSQAQRCSAGIESTQIVKHTGFSAFVWTSQTANITMECLQKVNITADVINEMVANIRQAAEKHSMAFSAEFSRADANTKLRNFLKTRITNESFQECVLQAKLFQLAEYHGVSVGIVSSNAVNTFKKCFSDALNSMRVAQTILNQTEQSSKVKSDNPLQPIADIFGGWGNALIIAGALILLVVIVIYVASPGSDPALLAQTNALIDRALAQSQTPQIQAPAQVAIEAPPTSTTAIEAP